MLPLRLLFRPTGKFVLSTLLQQVQSTFTDPKAYKYESVQSLWSGYGEISRYALPGTQSYCIVKEINLSQGSAHPKGWDSSFSHQRKLSSYHNELAFYAHYAKLCDTQCRVPKLVETGSAEKQIWLIMEDLDAAGFALRHTSANQQIALLGIQWLAHFHARFMQTNTHESLTKVWPIGTYWHLGTRPDEWHTMVNGELKQQAHAIDEKLNKARFQTLLHGDAKLANFCFAASHSKVTYASVAAVDFQYCGKGVGVKDLVYFLGSCFTSKELDLHAPALIEEYFQTLKQAITSEANNSEASNSEASNFDPNTIDAMAIEREWRALIPFAWADFERFLSGWSPTHHKRHHYSERQTNHALHLMSKEAK